MEGKIPAASSSKEGGGADESITGGWTCSDFSSSPSKNFDPVAALNALTPSQLLELFGSPEKEPSAVELRPLPEVPIRVSSAPSASADPSTAALCRTRSLSVGDPPTAMWNGLPLLKPRIDVALISLPSNLKDRRFIDAATAQCLASASAQSLASTSVQFLASASTQSLASASIQSLASAAEQTRRQNRFPTESICVQGHTLPQFRVDGLQDPHVCMQDVFRTFFRKRHWDEFKTILEANNITPVTIKRSPGEVYDVIPVIEVEAMLFRNEARKDGFARCLQLDLSNDKITYLPSKVISTGKFF